MIRLIRHKEIERWKKSGKWVLVYGRRKTGKSFFVKNFAKWDRYFFIGRSGEILEGDEKLSYDVFVNEVFRSLKKNKTVVIDEIQRLPAEFYDRLHNFGVRGNLIALSSTLWLVKNLLGKKSPLLGLFSEFVMNLFDESDVLKNLSGSIKDRKQLVEFCVYLREPWLLQLWEKTKNEFLKAMASGTKITVPALVGEIFSEEEKELGSVYEGVLKAISDGKRISGEIANALYSLRLIPAQNPSLIHPYLKALHELGLIEKTKHFGKNRYHYHHTSPVVDLFYYLDMKYGFSEREFSEKQIEKVIAERTPKYVEQFFGNLLSKHFGLWRETISEKDYEIDIALTDFKKLKVVAEVKWKKYIDENEIKRVEEVLNKFKDCKKILIIPNADILNREPKEIEVWDVQKILHILQIK